MYYHLKTKHGNTETVIDDNCGMSKFYQIADTLAKELKVNFISQVADASELNTLNWDFRYKDQLLTLHYNIFNGISVYPQHLNSVSRENNVVLEIGHFLESRAC